MLNKNDFKIFNYFSIFWLIIGWVAFILTLAGFFYWWIIAIATSFLLFFKGKSFLKIALKTSKFFISLNLFIISSIIIFGYFSNPTIFSGRDQGSISQASIRLAKFHQLKFSTLVSKTFFEINSSELKNKTNKCLQNNQNNFIVKKINNYFCRIIYSGKALNFSGFHYTADGNLITQFPLAYISWLATFYTFFGISGFILANAILFYIFIFSFIFIFQKIASSNNNHSNKNISLMQLIAVTLILSSFSFMWFFKFTLTENMALALLWLAILQTIVLLNSNFKKIKKTSLLILILSATLLIFTRIEGFVFFAIISAVLFKNKSFRNLFHKNFHKLYLPMLVGLLLIFIWNIKVDIYFYKTLAKAFGKDFSGDLIALNDKNIFSIFSLLKIFALYGILFPLFLGFFKIISFLREKDFKILIPFLIVSPAFIYLLNPQITPDHPWMLRRFVFAILPASILYTTFLIGDLIQKKNIKLAFFIIFSILFFNFHSFIPLLPFRPAENLLQETENISHQFSAKDLILIDRMASGNNWEMIADPMNFLFEKNAVYFFNPNDLEKLNLKKYARIYLIVPNERVNYYKNSSIGNRLSFFKNYFIRTIILDNQQLNSTILPQQKITITDGTIFRIKKYEINN
ncbi:MAG TPA: hypothetical protein ENJ27_00285 [Candidatus Moranbacteria bacterium]|nr:hypothetical protein [Candidatus Moranbacteria bacterium]